MAYLDKKTFHIIKYGDRRIKRLHDENFHVDDLIAPTIKILNQKGYFTAGCCAGVHKLPVDEVFVQNADIKCWILFKQGITLPSLPPKFHIEPLPQGFWIDSFEVIDLTSFVYITKVCDARHEIMLKQLYEWALGLPNYESTRHIRNKND